MKVKGIRFQRVRGLWHYDGPLGEDRSANPLDAYPATRPGKRAWPIPNVEEGSPYAVAALFLHVETDAGISGTYGPLREEEAAIIAGQIARLVVGEDPHAVERIWDKAYHANVTGRKGPYMQALSKVDLALWDLKGKALGAPVYELLGGPTRERVRAYASMLGYSAEPQMAAKRSQEMVAAGYGAVKWFFRHGHVAGLQGMRANLALVEAVRQAVGPDVEIMFDAWKSWNVPYTLRLAEMAAPYRPRWLEEPVMPDRRGEYAQIRSALSGGALSGTGMAVAGGEHEYTRWGMAELLDRQAVDILQPDPTWAGGLTEAVKICALASAHGIPVIPHHGGLASLHLIASQAPATCPLQEWILQAGCRDNVFLRQKIEPVNGYFPLPTGPGLGMELDHEAIRSREDVEF